jgi:tetratricopeptide (TPR) repeat protein
LFYPCEEETALDESAPIQELKQRLAEATADVARLAVLVDLGKRRAELPRDEVEGYLREAVGLARKTRRYTGLATVSVLLSEICLEAGDIPASVEWAGVVQEAARASGDPAIEGQYLYIVGRTFQVKGEYSSARDSYERCLEAWRKAGNTIGVGAALNQLGTLAMLQGQATEALGHFQECLKIDDELADIENGALHQYNIGELLRRVGRLEDAFESYYRVLALSERHRRILRLHASSLDALGELFLERDKTAKAIDLFRMAADSAERLDAWPDTSLLFEATVDLGLAYYRRGDGASARQAYSQALTMAEESRDRPATAVVLWRMAELALDQGQLCRCRDMANRAVAVSREMGLRCEEAQALRVMALCHATDGEDAQARECFEQALPLLRDLEESPDLARVRFHYGRYLLAQGEREAAVMHLRSASRKFRELGIAVDGYEANRLLLQQEIEGDRDMALLQAISGLPSLGVEPWAVLERAIELLLEALRFDCAVVVARGRPILVLGGPNMGRALALGESQKLVATDLVLSWPVRCGRDCVGRIHLERAVPEAAEQNCMVLDAIANLLAAPIQQLAELVVCAVEGRPELAGLCYRGVAGQNQRMLEVLATVCAVASKSEPVLIRGESGTGKKLIARALHDSGARAGKPFVAVNCAGVAEDLLEAEFFGTENGSASGGEGRKGKFETDDGGTLLLDEIGDLGPALQASLLRVLQEKAFERVGGSIPVSVDVRVVASTARPIEQLVAQGRFRRDLYDRLKTVELMLPSLNDRPEDVPNLVRHFVRRSCAVFGRGVTRVSPEAMSLLTSHRWPGNIRELEHAVECSVVLAEGDTIQVSDLPPGLQ